MNATKANTVRKNVTLSEQEATELKLLAEGLQITESELLKLAVKSLLNNGNNILMAQEKTAYPVETIATEGIKRYTNQLINQQNVGSKNDEIAQAYEMIKSSNTKYRSITSKLANAVGTNYNTVKRWLEINHPEELQKDK